MTEGERIRPASERDLPAINAIYNREVLEGVATWDLEPWSLEQRRTWFAEHGEATPVLVAEVDGRAAGFAYLSWYRARPGYRYTREDTIYVAPDVQGQGIGRRLLGALLAEASRIGVHTVVAWMEAGNAASIALHERFGFERTGYERRTGRKFGRWLDGVELQLLLGDETDAPPDEA